jgi:hypothetical protein
VPMSLSWDVNSSMVTRTKHYKVIRLIRAPRPSSRDYVVIVYTPSYTSRELTSREFTAISQALLSDGIISSKVNPFTLV